MDARKTAIVTGSSRGIGAAIVRRLARDGYAVVVNYTARSDAAERVVEEVKAGGGEAIALRADVSSTDDVRRLFSETTTAFEGIDVLVNNAGVMQEGLRSLADTDDETFDRLFAINVKGTFNTMRLAARELRDGGRVINFSTSVVGMRPPGYSCYGATKAAVETMSAIFAKELRGRNITVNVVAPGPTATDLFLTGKSEEQVAALAAMAPLQRIGTPEEIASVVSFLAGPDGAWINGQTIRANGGLV